MGLFSVIARCRRRRLMVVVGHCYSVGGTDTHTWYCSRMNVTRLERDDGLYGVLLHIIISLHLVFHGHLLI